MTEDITFKKLEYIKLDINDFIKTLESVALDYNHEITQAEKEFFIFIAKHIIFF